MRTSTLLLWTVAVASSASAQAPLLDGFGGAADYGTECLGPNDDGSSRAIDLSAIFPTGLQFFDRTHTSMFVNTNGNISFSEGLAAYTPEPFPIADQPIIAPFWADVDIRGNDCGDYPDGSGRPEYTYAGDCQSPDDNGVWWHLDAAGRRVIVTWDRVGYYRCHTTPRMSFQLVLTAVGGGAVCGGGGDFDVELRFAECAWNTGDASGGQNGFPREPTECVRPIIGPWRCPIGNLPCANAGGTRTCTPVPAQAGFDAGNTTDFVEIMGSRTDTIHTTLCTDSNVGEPGVWRFQIRSGVIECPDAGDPCETGLSGACATGRTQCVGGAIECRPEVPPTTEACDAVDDDCDGTIDEGDLCPLDQVCDRGVCIGVCFEGGCAPGQTCTAAGQCVDDGCESLTCPDGERCVAGACVAACDGVTCPAGRACRAGRCVDLCAGAVCDECTVCDDGDCAPSCEFADCPDGESCLEDGRCVEDACVDVACAVGTVCVAGSCVDACAGATCPGSEVCVAGECVDANRPDAGVAPRVDAGPLPARDAGPRADGAVGGDVDAGPGGGEEDGGCGCRAHGARRDPGFALLAGLALALIVRRRRGR